MKRRSNSIERRRRRIRQGDSRSGVAIVEFAIIANILLILVLTCIEFARMNMVRNLAQDAAYFAARHAMVPGATEAEARAEADRIMGSLLNNGYQVTVSPLNNESSQISVTVTVDFSSVALFAPLFLPDAEISTTATMRTERYDGFFQQ